MMMMTRRGMLLGSIAMLMPSIGAHSASNGRVTVYKDPNCGCCALWVDHLKAAGFVVDVSLRSDLRKLKAQFGVPEALISCHTAIVDGYVIEGHVPAGDIRRLVEERPAILGIAVGAMPVGSPGMEVEWQAPDPFDVMFFDSEKTGVFNSYPNGYRA
jgi:hypothetical protein